MSCTYHLVCYDTVKEMFGMIQLNVKRIATFIDIRYLDILGKSKLFKECDALTFESDIIINLDEYIEKVETLFIKRSSEFEKESSCTFRIHRLLCDLYEDIKRYDESIKNMNGGGSKKFIKIIMKPVGTAKWYINRKEIIRQ